MAGSAQIGSTPQFAIARYLPSNQVSAYTAVAPTVTAASIQTTAGTPFSGPIATFAPSGPVTFASDYTATIDWGDGSAVDSTAGTDPAHAVTITANATGGGFSVSGNHTYAVGFGTSAQAVVTVTHAPSGLFGSATDAVQIAQPPASLLNLIATSNGTGSVQLNWSAGDNTASGFRIESSTDGAVTFQIVATLV